MGHEAASQGMSWHTTGMAPPSPGQQLGKGGAFLQHQHNALHFYGISGGDKEHFIPFPRTLMCGREPDQLISVRKPKLPVALSDGVPQTLQFKVKSFFNNSSSPASDSTRTTPSDLQLGKGVNLTPDRSVLHPPSTSQDGNSQSPVQTSQSRFSSFPSPLTCRRSHPLAFEPVPPSKFCTLLISIEAAT